MPNNHRIGAWLLSAILTTGCTSSCERQRDPVRDETAAPTEGSLPRDTPPASIERSVAHAQRTNLALLAIADRCTLAESGIVIDVGHPASLARERFRLMSEPAPLMKTVAGQTVRAFDQMNNELVFWTSAPMKGFSFEAMVHAASSERLAAYVDGVRLGSVQLPQDSARNVRIQRSAFEVKPGRHILNVALSRPRGRPPGAEVSWLRLGDALPDKSDYPARRSEVFSEVTLDEERARGIIVKPRGRVRCPVWLAESSRLELGVGVWGAGAAEGEVALIDASDRRIVLATERKESDDPRRPAALSIDLTPYAGQLVELEFSAYAPDDGVRVAFVDPTLRLNEATPHIPAQTKLAVVVVMSSLGARHTPPQSRGLPVLNRLRDGATFFPGYRATSTSPTAVMASLLTGRPPHIHGISSHLQGLDPALATIAGAVEVSGGRSAFFTGVPTSFEAYGFDRGFETFSQAAPQADLSATVPLERATAWLSRQERFDRPTLAIVHLRGAHPPFDIPREQARNLPPAEYGGDLTPRRAAIQVGIVRARSARRQRLADDDWTRLQELEEAALRRQNAALLEFFEQLRRLGVYDSALIVVMGDVPSAWAPTIPYAEDAELSEDALAAPLLVKFPGMVQRGQAVSGHFAPQDVTKTIAGALRLDFETSPDAIVLGDPAASRLAELRPHLAFRKHSYSLRLGRFVFSGQDGEAPSLCFYELDPTCHIDRSEEHPATARALWLTTHATFADELSSASAAPQVEGDEALENALIVWGLTPGGPLD